MLVFTQDRVMEIVALQDGNHFVHITLYSSRFERRYGIGMVGDGEIFCKAPTLHWNELYGCVLFRALGVAKLNSKLNYHLLVTVKSLERYVVEASKVGETLLRHLKVARRTPSPSSMGSTHAWSTEEQTVFGYGGRLLSILYNRR